jgi:RNA polymerase sigma factor (sigma-70 family)
MTPQALLAPARLARKPILASQSDERLVDLVRAGYEPAFEAIVARYRGPLIGYCGRFLPEPRAEDVVQQTFVNAYRAMQGSRGELRLRSWLYRIAHNTALNALRDRGLQHEQLHDQLDGVERPDQAFERRQGLRELLASVQALPVRQRDALVLRELEGRSYAEIALELGVSAGAVRQLLNRARATLRQGASALTPTGLITRLPWSEPAEPVTARIAEVCGTGAGALAVKVCATALVTGAVVGGVATLPRDDSGPHTASAAESAPSMEQGHCVRPASRAPARATVRASAASAPRASAPVRAAAKR